MGWFKKYFFIFRIVLYSELCFLLWCIENDIVDVREWFWKEKCVWLSCKGSGKREWIKYRSGGRKCEYWWKKEEWWLRWRDINSVWEGNKWDNELKCIECRGNWIG